MSLAAFGSTRREPSSAEVPIRWIGLTVVLVKIAKVLKIAMSLSERSCPRVAQHGTRWLSKVHSLVVLAAFPDS